MIIHAWYPNHVGRAIEPDVSRLLPGDLDESCPGDDTDGDTAEICRMIELSGMISLECGLLEGE